MPELEPRIIQDPVWGETEISERVLLEFLDSKTLDRTEGISQLGLPQEYHYRTTFSRKSHNIGALLAVRKLTGTVEEQLASGLHDTTHSAFSHIIDWVLGSYGKDDHQDNIHKEFLANTEIPDILGRHGLDFNRIVDYKNFPLLEQPAPRLCADRVDYALREMMVSDFDPSIVPFCVDSLTVSQNRMVFSNPEAASNFGWGFMRLLREDWGGKETLARFLVLSNILKDSLISGLIGMNDFYVDDQHVLDLVRRDGGIKLRLEDLKKPLDQIPELGVFRGQVIEYKFRYVDPEFLDGTKLTKLSDYEPQYLDAINLERERSKQGVVI